MSEILFLGFACTIFKKSPLCRIYIDDTLVDEFDIPHTCDKKNLQQMSTLHDNIWGDLIPENIYFNQILPHIHIKAINFNTNNKKNIKLKIHSYVHDNNYTNGFISKTTLCSFKFCYIIDKKHIKNFQNLDLILKKFHKINIIPKTKHRWHSFYDFNKKKCFENLLYFSKYNYIGNPENKRPPQSHTMGGNVVLEINTRKQNSFWHSNIERKSNSLWVPGDWYTASLLANKYNEYEN
jgi:hypothetical protein